MAYTPTQPMKATATITTGPLLAAGVYTVVVDMPSAIVGGHGVLCMPLGDPGSLIIGNAWVSAPGKATLRITNLSVTAASANSISWLLALVRVPVS